MVRQRTHRDSAVTSRIMSAVRSKGSKAETALGKAMWRLGLRYRKHPKYILGRPDYAFLRPKVVVFCDGDFWHGQGWRERGFHSWDDQFEGLNNSEFWKDKIRRNIVRDKQVNKELRYAGWVVIRYLESVIFRDATKCAVAIHEVVHERSVKARQR